MTEITLAPYFHPTTICLVDDNESFLRSLSLEFPDSWACQTFTDPFEALAYLNEPPAVAPLVDRCFTLESPADSHALIHPDLNLIEQEINHPERFHRVSVVVADYAMPSMNGLELCRRAPDPYLQKAMLTSVADEKLAVGVFNAGLIHRFVAKHGSEATKVDARLYRRAAARVFQSIYRASAHHVVHQPTAISRGPRHCRVDRALDDRGAAGRILSAG